MATIYAEDWTPGNSLFTSVSPYQRTVDGVDPLYPYLRGAELVKIVAGMLDKDPAAVGEFDTYQQAGIWVKGAGALNGGGIGNYSTSGFWNAAVGCIECLYHPTTASLEDLETEFNTCPLIFTAGPTGLISMGVEADLDDAFLQVHHANEGEHDDIVSVFGAPMPVAGEDYKVRLGWQCGTYDEGTEIVAPDGFVRVWINDVLIYEATDISLWLTFNTDPVNYLDSVQFGFFGLLGPQSYFTISDSACPPLTPIQFRSGGIESPLAWMEVTLREIP